MLLEYQNLYDSLMLNPRIDIKEPKWLLAISDEEFQKFNPSQRNTLVSEFLETVRESHDATLPPKSR